MFYLILSRGAPRSWRAAQPRIYARNVTQYGRGLFLFICHTYNLYNI